MTEPSFNTNQPVGQPQVQSQTGKHNPMGKILAFLGAIVLFELLWFANYFILEKFYRSAAFNFISGTALNGAGTLADQEYTASVFKGEVLGLRGNVIEVNGSVSSQSKMEKKAFDISGVDVYRQGAKKSNEALKKEFEEYLQNVSLGGTQPATPPGEYSLEKSSVAEIKAGDSVSLSILVKPGSVTVKSVTITKKAN